MKYTLAFALMASLAASSAFAAFKAPLPEFKNEKQLAEMRAALSSKATSQGYKSEETAFYTGKPYLSATESYAFKYRSYDPELARWTSEDPSGFPDGANGHQYVSNGPNVKFDDTGLTGKSVLWATFTNLYGRGEYMVGNYFAEQVNYIDEFTKQYDSTKKAMNDADAAEPSNYLSDGDRFDKHVFADWNAFFTEIIGFTDVYVSCHGAYDQASGFTAYRDSNGADGKALSVFTEYSNINFIFATCANEYANTGNTRGLDGNHVNAHDYSQLPSMGEQTIIRLWE